MKGRLKREWNFSRCPIYSQLQNGSLKVFQNSKRDVFHFGCFKLLDFLEIESFDVPRTMAWTV